MASDVVLYAFRDADSVKNQPFSTWTDFPATHEAGANSRKRLFGLAAGVVIAFGLIAARVVMVQVLLAESYLDRWDDLTSEETPLPARNGRILARDGVILAKDESRYDVTVDYRWLESPPDPVWLRRQVSQRLSKRERKNPEAVARAQQQVLQQRDALFQSLAETAKCEPSTLLARAKDVQIRVERIAERVDARRRQRTLPSLTQPFDTARPWQEIWRIAKEELTTPPDRFANDPLILKEELQPHTLLSDVPLKVAAEIQSRPARFPGVQILTTSNRIYPQGSLAAHVIGIRRAHTPSGQHGEEPSRGESGIERAYDAQLSGRAGILRQTWNRQGEEVTHEVIQEPGDGRDITLTIDSRLQSVAEERLDLAVQTPQQVLSDEEGISHAPSSAPAGGVVIVMDIWTGELLCLAASPRPDLANLLHPNQATWQALLNDPRRPLFPRATHMALPPGSVYKVLTAVAALETGAVSSEEMFHCQGYLERPDEFRCLVYRNQGVGHGDLTIAGALCQSCNVFFFEAARRMGPKPLHDWGTRFGFGSLTGIDLPGEVSGHLPTAEESPARTESAAMQTAVGQGTLLVTPLQTVRMMAAIANGGYLVTPHIASQAVSAGSVSSAAASSSQPEMKKISGLSEQTLSTVRAGLELAVNAPQGTGRSAQLAMMTLAGKTGTAEVGGKPDHAWFAGYAPAQAPRIAFVVVLEHGGSGGANAGPIVRDLIVEMLGLGLLRPPHRGT